jgi:ubiquinone biosynthesis protein Coq4
MSRFQEALRAANNLRLLAAVGRSGGELSSIADLILSLGYDPEFFRPRDTSSDERWLTQRIATTHDSHHVVAGFGTEAAGENGVLAITAAQAHGHAIARQAQCLAAVRWEESWDKPVRQWREELGISDPADAEPYGLDAQLGPLP